MHQSRLKRIAPWLIVFFAALLSPRCTPGAKVGVRTASSACDRLHCSHTLVVYDDAAAYAWLGELYAAGIGTLVSHFGDWTAVPVSAYQRDAMRGYDAAIYIGSTFDQPLPAGFVEDVLAGDTPVVWIEDNIWELARRAPDFAERFGFLPDRFDDVGIHGVTYRGVRLARQVGAGQGIMTYRSLDTNVARVLAWAERDDGSRLPWAVRARHLTYVGENPLAYVTPGDRYLAFCDLLFDVLAPDTAERHRAVLRLEDVNPLSSPARLRDIADSLAKRGVPFSVAVIPVFTDPRGAQSGGRPVRVRLEDAPEVVAALRYMLAHGGSLVLHGYTHQYGAVTNPYSAVSGADFEFYRAHVDERDHVQLDGPVAEDSEAWATERIDNALAEVAKAGLPRPLMFEYPHYAGSPVDSRAIARKIDASFQREVFFAGTLSGKEDTQHSLALLFPFVVKDIYGWRVVPENLGNYIPVAYNQQSTQTPDQIVAGARALSVVRDGVAGFFFHPIFETAILERIVDDISGAGYTFVAADALASESVRR